MASLVEMEESGGGSGLGWLLGGDMESGILRKTRPEVVYEAAVVTNGKPLDPSTLRPSVCAA